ncbi:MAG: hypothetical protein RXQ56_07235 [Thermoproteus sp.]
MRAQEYAVAAAVTAEGAYLVAASLGLAPLTAYLAAGIPLIAFGLLYMALGDRRASLWGGMTALAGMALAMGAASPLLVLGVALLLVGLFALAAGRGRR